MISEDSTPKDDEITDGVDEGFVDESTTLSSSISEHLLMVGEGGTEEEAEERDEDKEEEPEDKVCPILI